jgi:hypothetical protein
MPAFASGDPFHGNRTAQPDATFPRVRTRRKGGWVRRSGADQTTPPTTCSTPTWTRSPTNSIRRWPLRCRCGGIDRMLFAEALETTTRRHQEVTKSSVE